MHQEDINGKWITPITPNPTINNINIKTKKEKRKKLRKGDKIMVYHIIQMHYIEHKVIYKYQIPNIELPKHEKLKLVRFLTP